MSTARTVSGPPTIVSHLNIKDLAPNSEFLRHFDEDVAEINELQVAAISSKPKRQAEGSPEDEPPAKRFKPEIKS